MYQPAIIVTNIAATYAINPLASDREKTVLKHTVMTVPAGFIVWQKKLVPIMMRAVGIIPSIINRYVTNLPNGGMVSGFFKYGNCDTS